MKKCAKCGKDVEKGLIVCNECGSGLFETTKDHADQKGKEFGEEYTSNILREFPKVSGLYVINKFIKKAANRQPVSCWLRINQVGRLWIGLNKAFKKTEIFDALSYVNARLIGFCPICFTHVRGNFIGVSTAMGDAASVITGQEGKQSLRFAEGYCPECSGEWMIFRF